MKVSVLYFPGCPNWQEAGDRLRVAQAGLSGVGVEFVVVDDDAAGFAGSPAFLVDGADLFEDGCVAAG